MPVISTLLQRGPARVAMLLALVMAGQHAASAEVFSLDGASADLRWPDGYCPLSRSHPVEKLYYDQQDRLQQGHNRVIQIAVLCSRQQQLRDGDTVFEFAVWLLNSPNDRPSSVPTGMDRSEFITRMAQIIPKIDVRRIETSVNRIAKGEGMDLTLGKPGVIDQNSDAVFCGLVISTSASGGLGGGTDLAAVYALSPVSGHVVTLNLYEPFAGSYSFDHLLASTKQALATTIAANASAASGK